MMRGLEWEALPVIVEMLGVVDVDAFVRALIQIREHLQEKENARSRD